MAKRDKSNYTIQAVANALDLLEQFTGDVQELGVTELSRKLNLHKNNVFRLLATLETRGYIEQNRITENYRLGLKSLQLGQTFIQQMGILKQSKPILEELVDACGETAYVAILKERKVIYLDAVESGQSVRAVSRVGTRAPAHATSVGKAQLASLSEDEVDKLLPEKLERHTENTITDREELKKHLEHVRRRGYSIDDEELEIGVKCVSVAVRDYTRRVVGAVSASGPAYRMTNEAIQSTLLPLVKEAADKLSTRLGYKIALEIAD